MWRNERQTGTKLSPNLIKANLSPGQTDSRIDASSQLASTCDSVWPGLACTCVDLRWLALTLVEIKFSRKSTQVFHRLAIQPKLTQVGWPIRLKTFFFFLRLACTCEGTCESIWPPNASLYTSSTCGYLRLLATTCESVWPGLYAQFRCFWLC